MTAPTSGLQSAMQGLSQALDAPTPADPSLGTWRWTVRQRMGAVRDALAAEAGGPGEGSLAAREATVLRERSALMARLSCLGPAVLESADVDRVRLDLHRLLVDIAHHRQRVHDLAYDEVELELGGSE